MDLPLSIDYKILKIIKDFSQLDLILCIRVLIYLFTFA